jgi:hypothetical protein
MGPSATPKEGTAISAKLVMNGKKTVATIILVRFALVDRQNHRRMIEQQNTETDF